MSSEHSSTHTHVTVHETKNGNLRIVANREMEVQQVKLHVQFLVIQVSLKHETSDNSDARLQSKWSSYTLIKHLTVDARLLPSN